MEEIKIEFGDDIKKAMFQVVEDLLQTDTFKVRIEHGSEKGDNFIGVVYRIIFCTADEKNTSKLFLKVAPRDDIKRIQYQARLCFLREIFVYEKILPYFRNFQEARDVTVDTDGFHEYSLCYKSIDTESSECLFLQDLTSNQFSLSSKNEITVEHIMLVMKALGKFHAISFAMKDQKPEKFKNIIVKKLREHFYKHGCNLDVARMINGAAMNVINSITDDEDIDLLEAVLKLYEQEQYDMLVNCVNGNEAEPYAVVIHGDLWSKNTLFQYNDDNVPEKVCFIDWQMSRYSSPVLDILYHIFLNTTRELRRQNYNMYLNTYYDSLSNHLERLGSNPEKVFPFSALQQQLQKFGKFALIQTSFLLPILTAEVDLQSNNNYTSTILSDGLKKRLRDIAYDIYKLDYI